MGGEDSAVAPLDEAVNGKREHGRSQQDHPDNRTHREISTTDDLLVDVRREHVVLAAGDLGDSKIRHHLREPDDSRADNSILGRWQRYGEENAKPACLQAECFIEWTGFGRGERSGEDHKRMWEAVEDFSHSD